MFLFIVACIFALCALVAAGYAFVTSSSEDKGIGFGAAFILAIIAAAAGTWSCTKIVDATEVGIPTTNGKVGESMQPGWHFTTPWTKVTTYSTRTNELSMLSAEDEGDKAKDDSIPVVAAGGGSMNVDLTVRWGLKPEKVKDLFFEYRTVDNIKDSLVRAQARSIARDVFGTHTAEEGYSTERGVISKEIEDELRERLEAKGIRLDGINMREVTPTNEVLARINNVLQARADSDQAKEEQNKRTTDAETKRIEAEKAAAASIETAKGDAEATRLRAEAQAEANGKIAASITPDLLALQTAQACAEAIKQTSAAVVSCGGSGSGAGGSVPSVVVDARS